MSVHTVSPTFEKDMNISGYFQSAKSGGQKTVYFPIIHGEKIVLKIIRGGIDDRFLREMRIYDQFKSSDGIPKIKKITNYGSDTILFEEYIEGNTLSDIITSYVGNSNIIKHLMLQISQIMKPIWEARYVHRDIKPENIIIRPSGNPVIIDFGIARDLDDSSITGAGFQPRSWPFASPEQYEGDKTKISYRTDFFSLGSLSYYLYHNRLPFGSSEAEIAMKFSSKDELFICDAGFTLEPFCKESMRFSPVDRPRFIDDFINLL
ncbi:MAG: protein kinase [Chitinophagaceae bacterium]